MTQKELSEYERGVVDTLEALFRETRTTTTVTDIELAAFDSIHIDSELVHAARENVEESHGHR